VSEEVILRELITQKDTQAGQLQADNQQLRLENKLLREKVDLLIKKIFGSRSEKLDVAQLELLLKGIDPGRADVACQFKSLKHELFGKIYEFWARQFTDAVHRLVQYNRIPLYDASISAFLLFYLNDYMA
jgi:hypothetical protein